MGAIFHRKKLNRKALDMDMTLTPHGPKTRAPAFRRRRFLDTPTPKRGAAQDMVPLLISAIVGALTTGAVAALLILSAPAYAGASAGDAAAQSSLGVEDDEQVLPVRSSSSDDPAPIPFTGPNALAPPPVCTCVLPPAAQD